MLNGFETFNLFVVLYHFFWEEFFISLIHLFFLGGRYKLETHFFTKKDFTHMMLNLPVEVIILIINVGINVKDGRLS